MAMPYFIIGDLAAAALFITNRDVLMGNSLHHNDPTMVTYRHYLWMVIVYNVIDALWGIFDKLHAVTALYVDTVLYFVAMACTILFWVHYAVVYLHEDAQFERRFMMVGNVLFLLQIGSLVANFFHPVVFALDANGTYYPGPVRSINLIMQIVLFLVTSLYTFYRAYQDRGATRSRNLAIGSSGLVMALLITAQLAYPLFAFYSVACMISGCVIHSFVVEDEEEEYRRELEGALERERQQLQEIASAKRIAYTDPLTGVKSKHAYVEAEEGIDQAINDGTQEPFGVAVFDLNNLKSINDSLGHEAGDEHIIMACRLICSTFKHSPVYRIGGDEFVALLIDQDYRSRDELMYEFDQAVMANLEQGRAVVASGLAAYDAARDKSYRNVFERADTAMYERKRTLKSYRR